MRIFEHRLSRRRLIGSGAAAGMGAVAIAIVGCGDDDGSAAPTPTPTAGGDGGNGGEPMNFALVHGWYRNEEVVYYDFGMNSPSTGSVVSSAPIWAFITGMNADGSPAFVEGQHNVVDVLKGEPGYSDLWELNLVVVPDGYEADSIRSHDDVEASGYEVMRPGLFVNCPLVPEGSTLEGGKELTQGWYEGTQVFYPDFGLNSPSAIPILVFATGMNADGSPVLLEGQNNIIDQVPGDPGYSAFWNIQLVMVDDSYEPNSMRSAADVMASGLEIVPTKLVVNCPVVEQA